MGILMQRGGIVKTKVWNNGGGEKNVWIPVERHAITWEQDS